MQKETPLLFKTYLPYTATLLQSTAKCIIDHCPSLHYKLFPVNSQRSMRRALIVSSEGQMVKKKLRSRKRHLDSHP